MTASRTVAEVYAYCDTDGTVLYESVRYDPKGFSQRVPLGDGRYAYKLNGVRRVPYQLPELRAAIDAGRTSFVVEGEKDADALRALGFCATTSAQGAGWKWTPEFVEYFRGSKRLAVIPDCDEGDPIKGTRKGREAAASRSRLLREVCDDVRVIDLAPDRSDGYDTSDWLAEGHTSDELRALVDAAPRVMPPSPIALQQPTKLVVLPELLATTCAFVREYVVVSEHQLVALGLWVLHTHAFGAAQTTPYIAITSAEPGSGKTRLLETLSPIVRAPWMAARISAAALVRKVDKDATTLLFDELDATFKGEKEKAEATRAILNSGYNTEGRATVCVGQGANIETRDLKTFCPKALAGIGKLPDTIRDRSIIIELKRKIAGEEAARFRRRYVKPQAAPIRQALETWAATAIGELTASDPAIPDGISDRAADCWEPLLAIADLAGEDWPSRAREAALALSGAGSLAADDMTYGVRLLSDIRDVFNASGKDRLTSVLLAHELAQIEESPWGPEHGKPFDARALASKLRPYRIKPKKLRLDETTTANGYERAHFEDSWKRYARMKTPSERNIRNNPYATGVCADFSTGTNGKCSGHEKAANPHGIRIVPDVPDNTAPKASGTMDPEPIVRPQTPLTQGFSDHADGADARMSPLLQLDEGTAGTGDTSTAPDDNAEATADGLATWWPG